MPATDERYVLAEGPCWDGDRDRVLWVDIAAGAVHTGRLESSRVIPEAALTFSETVGAVVSSESGELLVAGARRLYTVSAAGDVTPGAEVIGVGTASRLNDGGCDPRGRFLVGSLALDDRVRSEILVRVEPDGGILVIDDDLGLSNGLAFTPDGGALYSVDTAVEDCVDSRLRRADGHGRPPPRIPAHRRQPRRPVRGRGGQRLDRHMGIGRGALLLRGRRADRGRRCCWAEHHERRLRGGRPRHPPDHDCVGAALGSPTGSISRLRAGCSPPTWACEGSGSRTGRAPPDPASSRHS